MHWLDILILVILGVGAAMGFCTGLLWQVARVVSLAVSLYAAIMANTGATNWLNLQWKDASPAVNRVIAFVAVFIFAYLVLYFITRMLYTAIKASRLETVDRVLGAILGAVKMGAILACVCAVMVALDLQIFKDWFVHATLAPHFAQGTQNAVGWIPQHFRDHVDEGVHEMRDQVQKRLTDAALDAIKGELQKK